MTNEKVITILNSLKQYYNDKNEDSYVGFDNEDNEAIDMAIKALEQTKWIPIKYRPLTTEERIKFAKHYGIEYCDTVDEKAFDCPMPEDGQEILVSAKRGVYADIADNDIGGEGFIAYGLYENGDWEGIDAWMPLPSQHKAESEDEK